MTSSTLTLPNGRRAGDLPPETVVGGDLRIVSKIGAGGMGAVYLAIDTGPLGRSCAVKVLDRDGAGASGRGRFLDEAQIMASLRHPNIVPVSRFGTDEASGFDYYVMDEFLPTRDECRRICGDVLHCPPPSRATERMPLTLSDLIGGGKCLPEESVVSIALQMLSAIEAAHSLSPPVIHRDIKPSNILFAPDGRALLADFGIAKRMRGASSPHQEEGWTLPNATPGTYAYAAPEQLNGGAITPATDFYSLGLVLFRALTGGMPSRTAALPTDIAPHVSKSWQDLFARLLDQDPKTRLSDTARIRESLVAIGRDADRRRSTRSLFRNKLLIATLVAVAVAAVAAISDFFPSKTNENAASEVAAAEPPQAGDEQDAPQTGAVEKVAEQFDHKLWARQYSGGLVELMSSVMRSPKPDAGGRIIVHEGQTLLSGDIPGSDPNVTIVLDGGRLCFSPSSQAIDEIIASAKDFIAKAPDGERAPDSLLPTLRKNFSYPIAVTAKGGSMDTVDGEVNVVVMGEVKCADGVEEATLDVFGFSSITLIRELLDHRIKIAGAGRIANATIRNGRPVIHHIRWFDRDNPL